MTLFKMNYVNSLMVLNRAGQHHGLSQLGNME